MQVESTINTEFGQLVQSRDAVLKLAEQLAPQDLRTVADQHAVAAFYLQPVPPDPMEHLRWGYAAMRSRLERLVHHDPATPVVLQTPSEGHYVFRPRTVLRRVLDHALDHLNQIEQWMVWKDRGIVPVPADGWASSRDHLLEDGLPVPQPDLDAWLWRIDLVWSLLIDRAAQLTVAQLDWSPGPGHWTLRTVLHHVANPFYTVWLDDPLPDDPVQRYAMTVDRLHDQLRDMIAGPQDSEPRFYHPAEMMVDRRSVTTRVIQDALAAERSLLAGNPRRGSD